LKSTPFYRESGFVAGSNPSIRYAIFQMRWRRSLAIAARVGYAAGSAPKRPLLPSFGGACEHSRLGIEL
jgi:hypothetical protein